MSIYSVDMIVMNLHEECLLKYLLNPLDLLNTTEMLKLNNELIAQEFDKTKLLVKNRKINYTGV